jgi:hypothetical protein
MNKELLKEAKAKNNEEEKKEVTEWEVNYLHL